MSKEVKENDPVYFDGKYIGFRLKDGGVGLQRCGSCRRENYALSVLSGKCCWCGWDSAAISKAKGER